MKKLRYYYNPKSLNYEKFEVSWKIKFLKAFGWISTTLVVAIGLVMAYNYYFESPEERYLEHELSKMKLEYELLSHELTNMNDVLADLQKRDDNIYRVIFEAEPISNAKREAGFGGANMLKRYEGYDNQELMQNVATTIEKIKGKLVVQSKSYDDLSKMIKSKGEMLASIPAIQPISNVDLTRLASGWGYRIHPIYKTVKFHEGIDFTAAKGTEVYATGNGTVEQADNTNRGYGNHVKINHGYGYQSIYGHLSKFVVRPGQKVKRGELIGYVGSTGLSTAPHLHYEIVKNGVKINPINFFYNDLSPKEYERLIELANLENQSFD